MPSFPPPSPAVLYLQLTARNSLCNLLSRCTSLLLLRTSHKTPLRALATPPTSVPSILPSSQSNSYLDRCHRSSAVDLLLEPTTCLSLLQTKLFKHPLFSIFYFYFTILFLFYLNNYLCSLKKKR